MPCAECHAIYVQNVQLQASLQVHQQQYDARILQLQHELDEKQRLLQQQEQVKIHAEESLKNAVKTLESKETLVQDTMARAKLVGDAASDVWRTAALALDAALPEPGQGREYQGKPQYTQEYVCGELARLRGEKLAAEEMVRILQGRLQLQASTFQAQVKRIAAGAMDTALRGIEAPEDGQ